GDGIPPEGRIPRREGGPAGSDSPPKGSADSQPCQGSDRVLPILGAGTPKRVMLRKASWVGVLILAAVSVWTLPRMAHHWPRAMPPITHWAERVAVWWVPRRAAARVRLRGLTDPEQAAVRTLSRRLDGVIVWASNRTGQHQLFVVDLHAQIA